MLGLNSEVFTQTLNRSLKRVYGFRIPSLSARGGLRTSRSRWLIVLASSMLYFMGYFHRVSVTVIVEDLMRDFSVSATSLGLFSSLYFYPYAVMQIPAGLLVDSLGPRKTLASFSLLTSIGTLIFALAPTFPAAMLGRAVLGVGVSVAFLCIAKLISSWFDVRSFASLTGLVVSIGNIGALAASAPLALVVTSLGWRSSFLLIAA
ncbi:MFS transporter, partial [Candidatus Bathyarchaeota archaeon]|nr:MFS transporter [Candidatus Bathyarchaeota archaeon]